MCWVRANSLPVHAVSLSSTVIARSHGLTHSPDSERKTGEMSEMKDVMVSFVNLTEPRIPLGNGPLGMTLGIYLD